MQRSRKHREDVSQFGCLACWLEQYPALPMQGRHSESVSQAAHITRSSPERLRALSDKPSDEWVIPLCGADKQDHHGQFDRNQYAFVWRLFELFAQRHATMSVDPAIRMLAQTMLEPKP